MSRNSLDSFESRTILAVGRSRYNYHSLPKFAESFRADISRLPYSIKILLENLLRREDGVTVTRDDIVALGHCPQGKDVGETIPIYDAAMPSRGSPPSFPAGRSGSRPGAPPGASGDSRCWSVSTPPTSSTITVMAEFCPM